MAINDPVIAAGSTVTRANAQTVVSVVTPVIPPGDRATVIDGVLTPLTQLPEREGQMLFYREGSSLSVTGYVVVEINSALVWKKVENWGIVIDPRTGLEKDPNLGFYSTLAS